MTTRLLAISILAAASAASAGEGTSASDAMRRYFPNVTLRTQENKSVRFYDDVVKGKIVLINLMFTSCSKYCPITTPRLVRVQKELQKQLGDRLRMVSITIDAERDTPKALADYARRYGVSKDWLFLTGKREDVDLIRRKLGIYDTEEKKLEHMSLLTVGNEPEGQWLAMPVLTQTDEIVRTVVRVATSLRKAAPMTAAR
jgi:protein SCO1/2